MIPISVRFDKRVEYENQLLHEAGNDFYTVDLTTGEVTLVIEPPEESAQEPPA